MVQPCFDLEAPIIPGSSAAGFSLGMRLEEMSRVIATAIIEEMRPGFNSVKAVENCRDVLYIKNRNWSSLHYANDAVRLDFNSHGELCNIFLFAGYLGCLFNSITIGSSMHDVKARMPIFYDDSDEMFYPDWEAQPDLPYGIAFIASEDPDEKNQEWDVLGFSVHDYQHQRHSILLNGLWAR
ncbi:hypothetical protein ACQ4M4_17440 [Leptolyngbya sp. AN02str]|uniref:hypothetical protein n=1 Tax=Leptolyngbya sp. AN02str TaxID=3423363 RepID=UPI003D318062